MILHGVAKASVPTSTCCSPTAHCRDGLTANDTADTSSALANPTTYTFLIVERGWSPDRFEQWLGDSLARLLLP